MSVSSERWEQIFGPREYHRGRFHWRTGKSSGAAAKRGNHPAPRLMSADTMEPTRSMLDGKMYTSKSQLRRTYKEAGVTEVGNDVPKHRRDPWHVEQDAIQHEKDVEATIGRAFSQAGLGA